VSCPSTTRCVVVGSVENSEDTKLTPLVESWSNGAWSLASLVVPLSGASLEGVTCVGPRWCIAVGYQSTPNPAIADKTIIYTWNGAAWHLTPSGNSEETATYLSAVSCASTRACTAVGYSSSDPQLNYPSTSFALRWNGSSWSQLAIPRFGNYATVSSSISCANIHFCVVDGNAAKSESTIQPMEALLTGSRWHVRSQSDSQLGVSGVSVATLDGVDCMTSERCVGVGYSEPTGPAIIQSVTAASSTWVPSEGGAYSSLTGVWCSGNNVCMAVGYVDNPANVDTTGSQALAEES